MILTVTPNPALDRTLVIPHLQPGTVHRATTTHVASGGKGLNVARSVRLLGEDVIAVALVGGHSGQLFAELAAAEGIAGDWVPIAGETRTCVIVAHEDSDATVLNEPGPVIDPVDWARLVEAVLARALEGDHVALCGSLPPGAPADAPGDLIHSLNQRGVVTWVDTSGDALRVALGARPHGLKVNRTEAGELAGVPVHTPSDAARVAAFFRERGIRDVMVTLGADGAVGVGRHGTWHATGPNVSVTSSVGSGDAFFAGYLSAAMQGQPMPDALCRAVAAGTANTLSLGGGQFSMAAFHSLLKETRATLLEM